MHIMKCQVNIFHFTLNEHKMFSYWRILRGYLQISVLLITKIKKTIYWYSFKDGDDFEKMTLKMNNFISIKLIHIIKIILSTQFSFADRKKFVGECC